METTCGGSSMSAMTKKEWMEYIEKTWDAAQKEAWSEPQFECPRCGHCCHVEEEHMSREAMQQALEALESDPISHAGIVSRKQAITALRQALVDADDTSQKRVDETVKREHEWVGLTADEIWQCNKAKSGSAVEFHICYEHQNVEDFAESIEAKLKEKNT